MTEANDPIFPGLMSAGLTKREYFAAMAMQGIVAAPYMDTSITARFIATWAVEQADALLAELSK